MRSKEKLDKGLQILKEQGHTVIGRNHDGKMYWWIDERMAASWEEIEHFADGVYTLAELEELNAKRQAEKGSE